MVVKDFKASECFCSEYARMEERYRAVTAGGTFSPEEDFIPDRQDFAHVYGVLRREFRMGNDIFPERMLLTMVNVGAPRPINYVRLKYILEIFHELRICGVEEIETGIYRFDIFFNASKTNIEKSSILKNLKSRCHAEA